MAGVMQANEHGISPLALPAQGLERFADLAGDGARMPLSRHGTVKYCYTTGAAARVRARQ